MQLGLVDSSDRVSAQYHGRRLNVAPSRHMRSTRASMDTILVDLKNPFEPSTSLGWPTDRPIFIFIFILGGEERGASTGHHLTTFNRDSLMC